VHVLYVIDSVGTPGGAERSLTLLAPHYRDLGVRLDVVVLHDRPGHQEALRGAGAELFSVAGGGAHVRWVARTRALVAQRRPDLVHTTLFDADIVGRVAARLAGRPVVSSLVNEAYGAGARADPSVAPWKLASVQTVDALTARLTRRLLAVSVSVA
jgi:hypothetical protein